MTPTVKIGWLGTAHIHTPGFIGTVLKREMHCAGVWDHDKSRALMNAEKLGGSVAELAELVADPSVDGFVVCSETNRHLQIVEAAVKAGKPIFLEKPMGLNGADSELILAEFERSGCPFQTGYFSRGQANVLTLKSMLDAGRFGTVTRVRASNCHSGALGGWFDTDWRWMADRSQSGVGAFGDLGTHVLDLLMWMFGPMKAVTGQLDPGTARYAGCDELGEALLRFESGVIGTLAAGWNDVQDPFRLIVSGTKGYAVMGFDLKFAGASGPLEVVTDLLPSESAGFEAFLDRLEGKSSLLVAAAEAAARDKVMSAIYQGAESMTWVHV